MESKLILAEQRSFNGDGGSSSSSSSSSSNRSSSIAGKAAGLLTLTTGDTTRRDATPVLLCQCVVKLNGQRTQTPDGRVLPLDLRNAV